MIKTYLSHSGVDAAELTPEFFEALTGYQLALQLALQTPVTDIRWSYKVPELGEGGACSLFGQLAEQPYDLAATLGGETPENQRMLGQVTTLVQFYRQHSQSHWFGVYQKRANDRGEQVLVKLAYFGAESRAEFPLTPEFAALSNNSTVGLSGTGRVINDVAAYVSAGGEYYTCDPKVQAEACLPLLADDGSVVGIIDSEAFIQKLFVGKELALLIAVATALPALFSV